jgi:hypothetical protein
MYGRPLLDRGARDLAQCLKTILVLFKAGKASELTDNASSSTELLLQREPGDSVRDHFEDPRPAPISSRLFPRVTLDILMPNRSR